jgi:hypothetical protein
MPDPEARLPIPPTPGAMSVTKFGSEVMRWGTGNDAARARMATLTRQELERAAVTKQIAEAWRDFYRNEMVRNPQNPSASGRADLMQRAVDLLSGGVWWRPIRSDQMLFSSSGCATSMTTKCDSF